MIAREQKCPNCSRMLSLSKSGRCGLCTLHGWFELSDDPDAVREAAELNDEIKRKQQRAREEEERRRRQKIEEQKRAKQRSLMTKIGLVALVVALVAAAVVWKVVLPSMRYGDAERLAAEGNFEEAQSCFAALGGYRDSESRALMCDAMRKLGDGDVQSAVEALDAVGDGESSGELKKALADYASDWEANGIAPEVVLQLLQRGDIFEDGGVDAGELSLRAHVALLQGEAVSQRIEDVDGDQQDDLVVLEAGNVVHAYRMLPEGNAEIPLDHARHAQLLMSFGDELLATDFEQALACYDAAYRQYPNEESQGKLVSAHQTRASALEAEGNFADALSHAEAALEIANTEAAFDFFAQMELRDCQSQADGGEGIRMWDNFASESAGNIARYGREDWWRSAAAQLRLSYARSLASGKDGSCVEWLREAAGMGADIKEALPEMIERFDNGRVRAELRSLAIEAFADAPALQEEQRKALSAEILDIMKNWQTSGIDVQEMFGLLDTAREQGLSDQLDIDQLYRDAALIAAGSLSAHEFVDGDGDGREELLGLHADGELSYYRVSGGELTCVNSWQTGISSPQLALIGGASPVALVEPGAAQDAFAVFAWRDGELAQVAARTGVRRYARDAAMIRYDVPLPGSIERFERHGVDLSRADCPDSVIEVVWPRNDYPMPQSASDAVARFLEASYYQIPEEMALLCAPSDESDLGLQSVSELPRPDDPQGASCLPSYAGEDMALLELRLGGGAYSVCAVRDGSAWKLAGCAPVSAAAAGDASSALLCLNQDVKDAFGGRGEMRAYRISLPFAARVQLNCQTDATMTASLFTGDPAASDAYISYSLRSTKGRVQAQPLYLPAGDYWFTMTSGSSRGGSYAINLSAAPAQDAERESNDAQPNAIEPNRQYAATLQRDGDVDNYSFSLAQPGAVSVEFEAAEGSSSSDRFVITLASAGDGRAVMQQRVPAKTARFVTDAAYLSAGEYLMQITKGKEWYAGEYRFTVRTEDAQNIELEPNDSAETATAISTNAAITGASGTVGDEDFYSFTTESDGLVQLQMSFQPDKQTKDVYQLWLLNGEGAELWSDAVAGNKGQLRSPKLALPGGSYRVRAKNLERCDAQYQLMASFTAGKLEAESNNALGAATPIEINQSVYGALLNLSDAQTGSDIDNFSFQLERPSRVRLHFSYDAPGNKNYYFSFAVADASANALYTAAVTGEQSAVDSPNLYLKPGSYIVQVSPGKSTWPGAYQLQLEGEDCPESECERNDRWEAATQIAINTRIVGSFAQEDDIDCFSFALPSDGAVRPSLSFDPLESAGKAYVLTLSDGANELVEVVFGGKESSKAVSPILLSAGTYYAKLENPAETAQDYALSLSFEAMAAVEREPNDALAGATTLTLNAPIRGTLLTQSDVDIYLLKLAEETVVTLRFSFDPATERDALFTVQLEQNGKSLWNKRAMGKEGGFTQQLQIPAGEYYLRVKPAKWTNAIYTIEIG